MTQAPTKRYTNGSTSVQLNVSKRETVITFSYINKVVGDTPFDLNSLVISNSDGAFSYSIDDENVATVSGSTVTIVGYGNATINVTQQETANYQSGSTTASLNVDTNE